MVDSPILSPKSIAVIGASDKRGSVGATITSNIMKVKNITVLGSGVMGHGIAQISATAGYNVVLRDIKKEFLDKAMEKIKWSLK